MNWAAWRRYRAGDAAIEGYAGADIERAQYFDFDRECLIDPEPLVEHYEVLAAPRPPAG